MFTVTLFFLILVTIENVLSENGQFIHIWLKSNPNWFNFNVKPPFIPALTFHVKKPYLEQQTCSCRQFLT